VVGLETFRLLNGAIMRNTSQVAPQTEVHALLKHASADVCAQLLESVRDEKFESAEQALNSKWIRKLSAEGTALMVVHNCMNHSCAPNAVTVSNASDFTLSVAALKPLKKGEELCISYTDESQAFWDRQTYLKQRYLFVCTCPKCEARE
jgi:hypothetical protein